MPLQTECLGDFCSCDEIILEDVILGVLGNVTMRVVFERSIVEKIIYLQENVQTIVPNIFNENYNHTITFHQNGVILNNTEYKLRIVNCIDLDEKEEGEYEHSEYLSLEYN